MWEALCLYLRLLYKFQYEREKEKRRSMTAQIGKMRHLEMLLHDQQHLQAEIEKYQNRLKASDL